MLSMTAEPTKPPRLQRAQGLGRIVVEGREGRTRLRTLYQEGCSKIRLPNTHSPAIEAVLINTAGGLTGGDDLRWQAEAAAGARLVLTTQACERVYRTMGPAARVETHLSAGPGAHIDWLPQETILFEDSYLDRRIEIDLEEDATLTGIEAVLLGRDAMGEDARHARFTDNWRVRRNGRLIHAEATRLTGEPRFERDSVSLLAGARAFASLVHIGPGAERHLAAIRPRIADDLRIAASAEGERLVIRAMAQSGLALRRVIVPILADLSGAGSLPRLWQS